MATNERLFVRYLETISSPFDRQISMATSEKTYHDVWKYFNPPITL